MYIIILIPSLDNLKLVYISFEAGIGYRKWSCHMASLIQYTTAKQHLQTITDVWDQKYRSLGISNCTCLIKNSNVRWLC